MILIVAQTELLYGAYPVIIIEKNILFHVSRFNMNSPQEFRKMLKCILYWFEFYD